MKAETVRELVNETKSDVCENADHILSQGDQPEFSMTLMGNNQGKIFQLKWLEDSESNVTDVIRAVTDFVDALDETQSQNSLEIERGEIIGVAIGCLEALKQNPDVTFDEVIPAESEYDERHE